MPRATCRIWREAAKNRLFWDLAMRPKRTLAKRPSFQPFAAANQSHARLLCRFFTGPFVRASVLYVTDGNADLNPSQNGMIRAGFFQRNPVTCARELIGAELIWGQCSGVIVEAEAYLAIDDEAC